MFPMAVILIVEDELITREIAGMYIMDCGHHVLFANGAAEALWHLTSYQTIDALFTDIYLNTEVFGGCDVARQAQAMRPNLRVLYTSGNLPTARLKSQFVAGPVF
jgi:CheY-like chemotaxis protein